MFHFTKNCQNLIQTEVKYLKAHCYFGFIWELIIKMVSQARLVDRLCLDIQYSSMPSDFLCKQFHSS